MVRKSDGGAVGGLDNGVAQGLHLGVLNQFLRTDCGAQAAVVALGVVDPGQVLLHGDGLVGADLLAQTAADTAHGTGPGGSGALCHGVTGDDHIPVRLHRDD